MKEMHQSHVSGIFLGWSPKTFGCFNKGNLHCISTSHPLKTPPKNGLVISFRCWEPALVPCCADCHLPREQEGHQERKLELVKKKKRKSWKKPQLWLSWVTRALGSMSALRAYCAHEQAESNSEINCIMIEKIKWKAPTSEFVIEEMEINTFPQQRSWEEMWERKVFKVIL